MKVECSFCGVEISKAKNLVEASENSFCNNEHKSRYHDKHGRNREERLFQIVLFIQNHGPHTRLEMADALDIPETSMRDLLYNLRERDIIHLEREGKCRYLYKLKGMMNYLKDVEK